MAHDHDHHHDHEHSELSETQLKNNRVRVEVGTMAPIDIIAAQAEVAGNREAASGQLRIE